MSKERSNSYPSDFVSSSKKLQKDWILAYCRAAKAEDESNGDYSLSSRADRIVSQRKLAEGQESNENIKKRFAQGSDLSHILMDLDVSSPLPKLVKIAARTIFNNPYKPTAVPVDSLSKNKANIRRNKMIHEMHLETMRETMEANGIEGVIDRPKRDLPADKESLDLHFQMHPKIAESVAYEELINLGFKSNDFEEIKKDVAYDFVRSKFGGTRTYLDNDNNLKIRLVDIAEVITSWVDKKDFSDARHIGERLKIPISELREMAQGELEEKDLHWISENVKNGGTTWKYGDRKYFPAANGARYDNTNVNVWDIQIKTYDNSTHLKKGKKNGGFGIKKKPVDYESPKYAKQEQEIIHTGVQSIYEGYWVEGTDYVFGWRRKNDAYRERLNKKWSHTADFDYVLIAPDLREMSNKSLVDSARYRVEQMKLLELKAQQFMIQAQPAGFAYDEKALNQAIKGMGFGGMKPLKMINIKAETGSYFYSSSNEIGEPINPNGRPIEFTQSTLDQSIMLLANKYNAELSKLMDEMGVPPIASGGEPDKKALVGIQQLTLEGHKAALNDLKTAFEYVVTQTAKRVYMCYRNLIINKINIPEIEAAIGEVTIEEVKATELNEGDFVIGIEMLPDQFQKEIMNADLQQMVVSGSLAPEDKYEILRVMDESAKKAEVLMSVKAKMFRAEMQKQKEAAINAQTQGNAQVAQMAAQMEAQNTQLKYDLEQRNIIAKLKAEESKDDLDWENKSKYLILETEQKMKLIEKASEEKEGEKKKDEKRERKSTGYDIENDSIPREAGRIEPSIMPTTPSPIQ